MANQTKQAAPRNCIVLRDIDSTTDIGRELHIADLNKDGFLDFEELITAFEKMAKKDEKMKFWKWGFIASAFLVIVMACATFGLAWLAADLQRDSAVKNGVLTDVKTNSALQVIFNLIVTKQCYGVELPSGCIFGCLHLRWCAQQSDWRDPEGCNRQPAGGRCLFRVEQRHLESAPVRPSGTHLGHNCG
mmetsp:Transcript_3312/g.9470  ORF Transcript_3312/g.9470 Transcript_3312/m.9470 type:complete len:189 (-) Transcript_3312:598-1164(-)